MTMPTRAFRLLAVLGFTVLSISCLSPRDSRPVAEASGPSEESSGVPVESLGSLERVYVPLDAASLQSLDDALAEKGYGNVQASDFRPRFRYADTAFGTAVVAYSTSEWIESQSLFQPMTLTQWLEASLEDGGAQGVVINPGHPGQMLSLTRAEITQALAWLPKREPLPMEIYVTQ